MVMCNLNNAASITNERILFSLIFLLTSYIVEMSSNMCFFFSISSCLVRCDSTGYLILHMTCDSIVVSYIVDV